MKKWETIYKIKNPKSKIQIDKIIEILLKNRGFTTKKNIENFLHPPDPENLTSKDVGINKKLLQLALVRIINAVKNKERIVVYGDYDADGICATTIMWEALHLIGANVMPYIPHRIEEGYGFSKKGIDSVKSQFNPGLIISVDHGITAGEKISYAKEKGIETIVTDHHVKPEKLPKCLIVHTTKLCGAGISWFVVKELLKQKAFSVNHKIDELSQKNEMLALAAIGTIADLVPLTHANRAIVKFGMTVINKTQRIGLQALIKDSGLTLGEIGTYEISHILAPRLNAMGRLVHGLDALRLLCTKQNDKARLLAEKLGLTNRERQQMTEINTMHAKDMIQAKIVNRSLTKLIFVSHEEYNQGVIGLVAGKIVEEFYRPAIVISKGKEISKASARSINGFNIIAAIRSCSHLLVDAGGHPMAAGFTIETKLIDQFEKELTAKAEKELNGEILKRKIKIDLEIDFQSVTETLWQSVKKLEPFGMGNPEPVFATKGVSLADARIVGRDGKHLKLKLKASDVSIEAIGFGFGSLYDRLDPFQHLDVAFTIDMNEWNGKRSLQLKIKDIHLN